MRRLILFIIALMFSGVLFAQPNIIYDGRGYQAPQTGRYTQRALDQLARDQQRRYYSQMNVPLHIYGGSNHNVYLGCINCSSYDQNSIWNEYGAYGSPYRSNSIWNEYGTYGNEYSSLSPWNSYGSYPPVVVDRAGNFYGYFTVNTSKYQRAESNLTMAIYLYYDQIRDDVSGWYEKIFGGY